MGKHWLPRRYLRNFEHVDRPYFISLHDKRDGSIRKAEIAHVAQSKDFYSDETEAILTRDVEVPGNAAMLKLIGNTPIGRIERLQLALYMGVMLKRVPASRRRAADLIPGVLANLLSDVREQLNLLANEGLADPELMARRLQEVDVVGKKFTLQTPSEVLRQIREPWPSKEMVHLLFQMTWRVLVSSGPIYFMTTDNPAFFFDGLGLKGERSELSFPLSTTHVLHGSWQRADSSNLVFIGVKQDVVKEINRRLACTAERLAFYHEPASWIHTLLSKKAPQLNAIRWEATPSPRT